jgi:uncharacterized membrane protein YgdD (TMEM256/DUF423 family)
MNTNKTLKTELMLIGVLGALAVVLGAFGAHSLKSLLHESRLESYQTGIAYHFYHVFALALVAILRHLAQDEQAYRWSRNFFLAGIFCFSGSIYLLACRDLLGLGNFAKFLGPITPIGGVFFILGWLGLAFKK